MLAVVPHEILEIGEVVAPPRLLGHLLISGIQVEEIRIVGIGMVAGEQARLARGISLHLFHVQSQGIVVVFPDQLGAGGEAKALHPGQLNGLGGFGGMGQGIQGGPVGVSQRALCVVGIEFIGQEIVHGLGHENFGGVALVNGQESSFVIFQPLMMLVEGLDAVRLPLAAQDDRQGPLGHIGPVGPTGVTRPGRKVRAAVDQVHHRTHFRSPGRPPASVPEIVVRRQLGPDAVDQPDGSDSLGVVISQSFVEVRRMDGVHPHHIDAQRGHLCDPARVDGFVRELAGMLAGQRSSQVDALDEEGTPAILAIADLESLPQDPRGHLEPGGANQRVHGRRRVRSQTPGIRQGLPYICARWILSQGFLKQRFGFRGTPLAQQTEGQSIGCVPVTGGYPARLLEQGEGLSDAIQTQSRKSRHHQGIAVLWMLGKPSIKEGAGLREPSLVECLAAQVQGCRGRLRRLHQSGWGRGRHHRPRSLRVWSVCAWACPTFRDLIWNRMPERMVIFPTMPTASGPQP